MKLDNYLKNIKNNSLELKLDDNFNENRIDYYIYSVLNEGVFLGNIIIKLPHLLKAYYDGNIELKLLDFSYAYQVFKLAVRFFKFYSIPYIILSADKNDNLMNEFFNEINAKLIKENEIPESLYNEHKNVYSYSIYIDEN